MKKASNSGKEKGRKIENTLSTDETFLCNSTETQRFVIEVRSHQSPRGPTICQQPNENEVYGTVAPSISKRMN